MKKVTIVTPVYKVENFIADCVQSVIKQTYPCIEFILTDDHGGDRSVEIAKEMLSKVRREGFSYHIIDYGCNKGVSVARNEAMKAATGDYIFCLDSDDKLNLDCIEKLVIRAEETDADVVICGHYSDKGRDKFAGHLCAPVDIVTTNLDCIKAFAENWFNVAPWGKLLKTEFVHKNNLYFEPGIINEDAPWTFQLCLFANRIAFLHEDLYYYRYNDTSIMSKQKKENVIRSNDIALNIFINEAKLRPSLWSYKDLYIIIMRQIIIFYTLCFDLIGYKSIMKYSSGFKALKFHGEYFSPITKSIPTYYRLWNIAFCLPKFAIGSYLYNIILLQKMKQT